MASIRGNPMAVDKDADFGYKKVSPEEKTRLVREVFHSVAPNYDLMNDLMSLGIHRAWKFLTVLLAQVRPDWRVLDLAGGTGDLAQRFAEKMGPQGRVVLGDINLAMLEVGRDKIIDAGLSQTIKVTALNAEALPFAANSFDLLTIGFGLRNVTDKQRALQEMWRVLRPGGQAMILEFSTPTTAAVKKLYDAYSFKILPKLGQTVAKDRESYQYLAESIRKHPPQEALKQMVLEAGFDECEYHNLSMGIVALHRCFKY
jgi:demethylmenaquinone methyltransferase/2-methoxy-6-polyprenyl-1,4-benzoquinol methylase